MASVCSSARRPQPLSTLLLPPSPPPGALWSAEAVPGLVPAPVPVHPRQPVSALRPHPLHLWGRPPFQRSAELGHPAPVGHHRLAADHVHGEGRGHGVEAVGCRRVPLPSRPPHSRAASCSEPPGPYGPLGLPKASAFAPTPFVSLETSLHPSFLSGLGGERAHRRLCCQSPCLGVQAPLPPEYRGSGLGWASRSWDPHFGVSSGDVPSPGVGVRSGVAPSLPVAPVGVPAPSDWVLGMC